MRLTHFISNLERGGAQAVLYDLVRQLEKKGYHQSVIYLHDGPYYQLFKELELPLYQIKGIVTPFDPIALVRLFKLLKQLQPNCLHTVLWAANWMGRIVAKKLTIPSVAALHNNYDQNGWLRNLLDRFVPFSNEAIVAVSEEVKETFIRYQRASCQIIIIHNGIDWQTIATNKSISRKSIGLRMNHFIIGSVGRFVPIKRYSLLLHAFALVHRQYPHARLLLIGVGPEEENLRLLAHHLAINAAVIWVIDEPAQNYYPIMDCFILTSQREGISIALLEAMSCAKACVVTCASERHSVLTNMRNGIVAFTDDATIVASSIERLMNEPYLCNALAQSAQQTIRAHFDNNSMIAAYDHVFKHKSPHKMIPHS